MENVSLPRPAGTCSTAAVARIAMLRTNRFTHDARVAREARTLAEAGHDVTVHCLAGKGLATRETDRGITIVRHTEPGWLSWTGPARLVPLLRWYGRYEFLARAAEGDRPDVVHGHDLETLLPSHRLATRLGVPHVHHDHEICWDKLGQGVADWVTGAKRVTMDAITAQLRRRGDTLERRIVPSLAGYLTASPLYADRLEERLGRRPVVLLNTPPRTDPKPEPRLRADARLPPDARVVLYQGGITPSGGAEQAIDAAVDLPEGWYLVFLGATWMRPRLEERVRERDVSERVRFLDPVPPDALPAWTRAADVGLSPIRATNPGQARSLANKLFEYLQAGLPMVVSDLPGQGAFVRDLKAGEVLPEVTPQAIANAVGRLARFPEGDLAAWGARLRKIAHERYCWEIEREKLLALYRTIPVR
jgi:glycosyltransferase involved in cell wall biosynthesis